MLSENLRRNVKLGIAALSLLAATGLFLVHFEVLDFSSPEVHVEPTWTGDEQRALDAENARRERLLRTRPSSGS